MTDPTTSFEHRAADWLPVAEALDRVLAAAQPLPVEDVEIPEALGQALARSLDARATLPPWDNSAMDGYAVQAVDIAGASHGTPIRLEVVGENRPGLLWETAILRGQALRIMTGAAIPPGADSVVRVEDTDEEEEPGTVVIRSDRDAGRHVRPGGQDMSAGEMVLEAGSTLSPGALAVAAALGHPLLPVHRRPVVAVLSSGDELRGPHDFDDVIAGRGIPETNGTAMAAAIRAIGADTLELGIALDEESDIRRRVAEARGADLLITSGGASMGEADLFKRVLEEEGLTIDFWRVRMRPGSPLSLGHLPRPNGPSLPVLGLPGNPASAFVTFQIFARPFVLRLGGHARVHRRVVVAEAAEHLASTPRLTHFHRITLSEDFRRPQVRLAGHPGSGLVRGLAMAQGLAVVPEGVAAVEEGEPVAVILLDDAPGATSQVGFTDTLG